jgi:hypothetical protein
VKHALGDRGECHRTEDRDRAIPYRIQRCMEQPHDLDGRVVVDRPGEPCIDHRFVARLIVHVIHRNLVVPRDR